MGRPRPGSVLSRIRHQEDFCWYCGRELQVSREGEPDFATRDHVRPASRNGKGGRNLIPACRSCNSMKKDRTLDEFRDACGGGLFWGELFSTRDVLGGHARPRNTMALQRWLTKQTTMGADDWMVGATCAANLRSMTHSQTVGGYPSNKRTSSILQSRTRWVMKRLLGVGFSIETDFAGVWLQILRARFLVSVKWLPMEKRDDD